MWLIPGGIAGVVASSLMRGLGHGMFCDVGVGMIGAVFGGWAFGAFGMPIPDAGLPGTIVAAFSGAVTLLFLAGALTPSGRRRFA